MKYVLRLCVPKLETPSVRRNLLVNMVKNPSRGPDVQKVDLAELSGVDHVARIRFNQIRDSIYKDEGVSDPPVQHPDHSIAEHFLEYSGL